MDNKKQMLSWALLLAGLVLLAGCGKAKEPDAKSEQADQKGGPRIAAVQESFDFGKVKQGTDVEHVFKIKNTGAAELEIKNARGS